MLVTTHSPFFLQALRPKEVIILHRNKDGFTEAKRVSDIANVDAFYAEGATLGDLWTEGYFGVGDPMALPRTGKQLGRT
jgi:hypothetical protein